MRDRVEKYKLKNIFNIHKTSPEPSSYIPSKPLHSRPLSLLLLLHTNDVPNVNSQTICQQSKPATNHMSTVKTRYTCIPMQVQ